MKVFTAYHPGVFMGGNSVITAHTFDEARDMLVAELKERKLDTDELSISEVDTSVAKVRMLNDGDY